MRYGNKKEIYKKLEALNATSMHVHYYLNIDHLGYRLVMEQTTTGHKRYGYYMKKKETFHHLCGLIDEFTIHTYVF